MDVVPQVPMAPSQLHSLYLQGNYIYSFESVNKPVMLDPVIVLHTDQIYSLIYLFLC